MRRIYLCLFWALCIGATVYGQEAMDSQSPDKEEIEGFKLYPNPATTDMVYITSKQKASKNVVVFDVFGETVLTDRIAGNALNIQKLNPGVYVLQVTENDRTIRRKLVVK